MVSLSHSSPLPVLEVFLPNSSWRGGRDCFGRGSCFDSACYLPWGGRGGGGGGLNEIASTKLTICQKRRDSWFDSIGSVVHVKAPDLTFFHLSRNIGVC